MTGVTSAGRRVRGLDADQRRKQRRDQLLATTLDLLAAKGYQSVSIEQICQTAYVSTKSFYELFDSKDMRSLRSSFYPFYLDSGSFRRPGFVGIGVAIVFLLLFIWQALPAWGAWRDPERHPLAQRIAKWGDPIGSAVEAEHEFNNSLLRGKHGWRFGNKLLLRSSFFSFNVLRLQDVLWAYKKITKHSVNFIPTGKTYEAIVHCYGGNATIPGSEKKVNEMLTFVQQRAPWAIYGYSEPLAATFNKQRQEFARGVEQRKQDWAQKTAPA